MKAWIVYDSVWGNTERVARSIGEAVGREARVFPVAEADPAGAATVDLLVVASPTQGGRPTAATQGFLDALRPASLGKVRVAAFDTRIPMRFAKLFGYAAGKIAACLVAKGGNQVAAPEGFLVRGRKGPLADGELERAAAWGKKLV